MMGKPRLTLFPDWKKMYEFRGASRYTRIRKESGPMVEKPRLRPLLRKEALLIF